MPVYREQLPSPALKRWVECAWCLESRAAVDGYQVTPDGCVDILYQRGQGLRVVGAMTVTQSFQIPQAAFLAGVRFRPAMARAFLRIPAVSVTDSWIPLEEAWAGRAGALARRLDDSRTVREAMQILLDELRVPADDITPVQKAIEFMTSAGGAVNLARTAEQAGLSERQFRRRCLQESGLSPKLLGRVLRFRHAWERAWESWRPDWKEIAAEAEYFDQAHLIKDCRGFTGQTPMAVLSNTRARCEL